MLVFPGSQIYEIFLLNIFCKEFLRLYIWSLFFAQSVQYELPYDGAKEMLLVEEVDDRKFLEGLFQVMYDELPNPKNKK